MKKLQKNLKNKAKNFAKRAKAAEEKEQNPPRVTNTTLERHKREIFDRAKPLLRPLTPNRRKMLITTASLLIVAAIAFLAFFGVLIYHYKNDSSLVYSVSRIIPYPIARVNNRFITYDDYLLELKPLKNFYQSPLNSANQSQQVDFSTPEGQEQLQGLRDTALNEAKRKLAVKELAKVHNVKVSRKELNEEVEQFIAQAGDAEKFADVVDQYYGWSVNEFRQAVHVQLLREKLLPAVSAEARQKAANLEEQAKNGADFAKLAKEHSEDPGSRENGGDLGFATRGKYVPAFEEVAFNLEKGKVSDVVQTQYGFHIIKMIEKKSADEVKVAHILIPYEDLNKYIQEYLANAKINDYIDFNIGGEDQTTEQTQEAESE